MFAQTSIQPLPLPSSPAGNGTWRDGFGVALFALVMCFIAIPMGLPSIIQFRWVLLAGMLVIGLQRILRNPPIWTHEYTCLLIFSIIGAISCAYSFDPTYSAARLVSVLLLLVVMLGAGAAWIQTSPQHLLRAADIMVAIAVVVTLVALFKGGLDESEAGDRLVGAFGKATGAGGFAASVLPILLWTWFYQRGVKRLAISGCIVIQMYLLLFSGARGAMASSAVGVAMVLGAFYPRLIKPMIAGAVVMSALLFSGVLSLDMLPAHMVRAESLGNLTGRLPRYEALMHVWKKQPVIGYGFGVSRFMIVRDYEALMIYLDGDTETNAARRMIIMHQNNYPLALHSHNDHIERLVENGIIGYLPYGAFWLLLLIRVGKAMFRPVGKLENLIKCLGAVVVYIFVESMLHSAGLAAGNGTTVWMWLVMTAFLAGDALLRRMAAARPVAPPAAQDLPVRSGREVAYG